MKILGIDYGEKRIGLAVSDESQTLARELDILAPKDFFKELPSIIADNQISQIVLGWPLNMEGKMTEKTKEVESFKLEIQGLTFIPVEVFDERLSSSMTKNLPGGHEKKDSLAAQIILQNYLNKNKHNPNDMNSIQISQKQISDNSDPPAKAY